MFCLDADRDQKIMYLTITGIWNDAIVDDYERERCGLATKMGWSSGDFGFLVETTFDGVHPPDVLRRSEELFKNSSALPGKIAFIVVGALAKIQTRRLSAGYGTRLFDDRKDAIDWLLAPSPDTGKQVAVDQ